MLQIQTPNQMLATMYLSSITGAMASLSLLNLQKQSWWQCRRCWLRIAFGWWEYGHHQWLWCWVWEGKLYSWARWGLFDPVCWCADLIDLLGYYLKYEKEMLTLVWDGFQSLNSANYLSSGQIWEDMPTFCGDLKKLSQEIIRTSYEFLPTKAQAASFWSPQHHFNCIKWKIMELLTDGEFLHDGVDDNVMCLFILTSQGLTDVLTLESHQ